MEEEERIDGIISERGEIAEPPQFPAPVMRNVEYQSLWEYQTIYIFGLFQLAHGSFIFKQSAFHVSFI